MGDHSGARGDVGRHRVRRHHERRRLSGRQLGRVRGEVLPPVPGLPLPDLRDPGQSRLVRRAPRVHVPPLRGRRDGVVRSHLRPRPAGVEAGAAPPALAAPDRPDTGAGGGSLVVAGPSPPALGAAFALLGDRHRSGADRGYRHRDPRPARPRSGRVAARGLAGPEPSEDPPDRKAAVRGRRVPPRLDRRRRNRR